MTPTPRLRLLDRPDTAGTPPVVVEQAKPPTKIGSSGPRDDRSWSTITWPGNVLFVVFLLVALLFVFLAVKR